MVDSAMNRLKKVHPDALNAVKRILEARAQSALQKLSELELRSEVCKTYAILADMIDEIEREARLEDADTAVVARQDLIAASRTA